MKAAPLSDNKCETPVTPASLGVLYSPAGERFDRITKLARSMFHVPLSFVALLSDKCQWFKPAQGSAALETPREMSFCARTILKNDTLVIPDTLQNPEFSGDLSVTGVPHIRFYAGHPIKYKGAAIGVLCIIDQKPHELSPGDLEALQSLALLAETELNATGVCEERDKLALELKEAQSKSLLDPATKLWNRDGMDAMSGRELSRVKRGGKPVSVMLIDIDNLKAINDKYGKDAGDAVVVEVASRIYLAARPTDIVARYQGDEFFILASECSDEMALYTATRISADVKGQPIIVDGKPITVTVSIGTTTAWTFHENMVAGLIVVAGRALSRAKSAGPDNTKSEVCFEKDLE